MEGQQLMQLKKMNSSFITNKGKRKSNQDVVCIESMGEDQNVFLLADGMGGYKNGEYAHNEEGVWEALEEEFKSKDRIKIRRFLSEMRIKRGRNDICFCGSGKKYKKCHLPRIKIIKDVSKRLFLT